MAWAFSLSNLPATGGEAIWLLKEFLVAQGWSVARSGSGSGGAFNAAGDVHAPGGPYAGTLDLANAWFEIRQPVAASPRRSILFQTPNTNGHTWRTWYSSDGTGFTGGTPSATARGTAADEQGITNTPTGTTQWLPANASYRLDMIGGDSAEGFSFFFGCRRSDESSYAAVYSLDVLSDADAADVDPAIIGTTFQSGTNFAEAGNVQHTATTASQTAGCQRGWYKKGLAGATFAVFPNVYWGALEGGTTIVPLNNDRQTMSPTEDFQDLQVWYWRGSSAFTTQRGYKGKSRLFRTIQPRLGLLRPNVGRTRMGIGVVSVPWDGSTIPVF
jgi:hypothetical protein